MQAAPAWLTDTVRPPTLTVALRATELGFAVALNVNVPLPVPLAEVRLNQPAVVVAVHVQPAGAVIAELLPVLAVAASDTDAGDTA